MPNTIPMEEIKKGYKQTDFEIVSAGGNDQYELPVSESVCYRMKKSIDVNKFENKLSDYEYTFISPYSKIDYLSSKIYDSETNEFFHIKINDNKIRIYPKSEEFSMKTFKRFVNCVHMNITGIKMQNDN